MSVPTIKSLEDLLSQIEKLDSLQNTINLFRGQSSNFPLLPSICRKDPKVDTTDVEIKMLEDFKRRSPLLITKTFSSDWEWLIYAQHFGLKTRLLDWTSNPLVALWFACKDQSVSNDSSYLYILSCNDDMQVDLTKNQTPFDRTKTKILRPTLNNERIIAQSGWFTAHKFSQSANCFVNLEKNADMKSSVTKLEIPSQFKEKLLKKLSMFGVNNRTVFPDVNGLSMHLNWKYLDKHF